MKRPVSEGLVALGMAALLCFTAGTAAFGQESCPFSFSSGSPLSSYLTIYPDGGGNNIGTSIPSTFLVNVTNTVSGTNPPIPDGDYAAWCMDAWTPVMPQSEPLQLGAPLPYSGVLYATCDTNLNKELPPGHSNTLVSATTWLEVDYILNNHAGYFYWDVQAAINTFVGSGVGSTVPGCGVLTTPEPDNCGENGAGFYPAYSDANVGTLTNEAIAAVQGGWVPTNGDVIGVVYVTATNSQFILLEVPYGSPVTPEGYADLAIAKTGAPNPVLVSNQLTYTLYVTNLGPTNVSDAVVTDTLPASVTFLSATVSQGSPSVIPGGLEWNVGALNVNASASATVVVVPFAAGTITNTATVALPPQTPLILDTNPANNTASVVTLVVPPTTNPPILALGYGAPVLNPQTGLFDQTVTVSNLAGGTAPCVVVAIEGLASNIVVYNVTGVTNIYNPSGLTNNAPYIEDNQPLPVGSNVVFLVEYYEINRLQPLVSTNFYLTVLTPPITSPLPTGIQTNVVTLHFVSQGQFTIEFSTVRGHTYVVEYSSSLIGPWMTAGPPIVAANNRTQWIDDGPPVTASPPGNTGERFYRVVETN